MEEARKPAAAVSAPPAPPSIPRSAVPQAYQKAVTATQGPPKEKRPAAETFAAEIAAALSEGKEAGGGVAVLQAVTEEEYPRQTERRPVAPEPATPAKEEKQRSLSALYESMDAELEPAISTALESDVLREIRDMKQWMERIARYSSSGIELPQMLDELKRLLIDQDTDAVLVEEWIGTIYDRWNEEGRTWTADRFTEMLQEQINTFLAGRIAGGIAADTSIVYIAGPTGVGKTTSIAKLAAEQLFKHGRKVGLITSDTYRISAVEQLRTYAAILNIPLEVVQSPGDLQRAMFRLESCDLVLMDTAGRNYRNEMFVAELQSLLAKELKSETFLVLSMTSKSRDMKLIAEHFGRYQLDKVIFTKLDETGSYGPLFNVLNDFPLKLSYLTNGQNVPDDLLMASKELLSEMLLGTGGS